MTQQAAVPAAEASPNQEKLDFLGKYWNSLMEGDFDTFASIVDPRCVVHYPGNHFLSGDHRGVDEIVRLYKSLYKIGIQPGTFAGELHDALVSDHHGVALVTYEIVLGMGFTLPGQAIGVFHIEDGKMVEYWLLERDQKMINDIFAISGRAALSDGGNLAMARGALTHPLAVARTIRRVVRLRRGKNDKML